MNNLPLPQWLLRLLSVDLEEGGEASLRLARFPEGELGLLALLAVGAGLAAVFFTYSREGSLARWKKYSVASIRALLVLLLALIVFYPVIEVSREEETRKATILLLDDSLSLTLKDRYQASPDKLRLLAAGLNLEPKQVPGFSRADLVNRLLRDPDRKLLELLEEKTASRSTPSPMTFAAPPTARPGRVKKRPRHPESSRSLLKERSRISPPPCARRSSSRQAPRSRRLSSSAMDE